MNAETYIRHGSNSFHILRTWTRVSRRAIAMCGRSVMVDDERATLPPQKTCESCYRSISSREQEGEV